MAYYLPTGLQPLCTDAAARFTTQYDRGGLWYANSLLTDYSDPETLLTYDEWMEDLAAAGVNLVRIRLTGRTRYTEADQAPSFELPPYSTFNIYHNVPDPTNLTQYRADQVTYPVEQTLLESSNVWKLIQAAETHGVGLWITFFENNEFQSGWLWHAWNEACYYHDNTAAEEADQGFLTNAYEFFDDATAIQAAKDRISFVIDQFGSSTAIQCWEIGNEMSFLCTPAFWDTTWTQAHIDDNIRGKMVPWFSTIAAYIRSEDSQNRPIISSQGRTPPYPDAWSANENDFWNVVNEIHDDSNIDIVAGRGYLEGDLDALMHHIRLLQEKFPDRQVVVGEHFPFDMDRVDPADEDPPYLLSKTTQWAAFCGARRGCGAMRWPGLEESYVNTWILGGLADTELHTIGGVTTTINDYIDWDRWDDSSEDWEDYLASTGSINRIGWGDGSCVLMMLKFSSSGSKTVTVSNLTNGPYTLRVMNWVTGALDNTQRLVAASGSLSFDNDVFTSNILVAYLEMQVQEGAVTPSGALAKQAGIVKGGGMASAGGMVRRVGKVLGGMV